MPGIWSCNDLISDILHQTKKDWINVNDTVCRQKRSPCVTGTDNCSKNYMQTDTHITRSMRVTRHNVVSVISLLQSVKFRYSKVFFTQTHALKYRWNT